MGLNEGVDPLPSIEYLAKAIEDRPVKIKKSESNDIMVDETQTEKN